MADKKSRKKADDILGEFHDDMGNKPDGEIAQLAGVQRNTVMAYRRRHGIPSYQGHRFKPKSERQSESSVQQVEATVVENDTPTLPATPVAPEAPAVPEAPAAPAAPVAAPAPTPTPAVPAPPMVARKVVRPRQRRRSKLDPYVAKIGILPDREVAEIAGVTSENVRAFRNRRGIPARWRGEGEPLPNEQQILAEAGRTPVEMYTRKIPASSVVPVAPAVAAQVPGQVMLAQGFVVTVEIDDSQEEFVVVGADIAQASAQAISSLVRRGVSYKVLSVRYLADALIG